MITRHHDNDRIGKFPHNARETRKCMQYRGIRRPNRIEYITRHNNQIGTQIDRQVHRFAERRRHISLALIDARRGQTLILTETQMQI